MRCIRTTFALSLIFFLSGPVFGANPPAAPASGAASAPDASAPTAKAPASTVSASSGDYIGDCFTIRGKVDKLTPGKNYLVSAQTEETDGDRTLTLLAAHPYFAITCAPDQGADGVQVAASALTVAGATRRGWTYGVLTMPYKYYSSTKTFSVNAPIGGYLGFRFGQVGGGYMPAFAFTLSSVKANTIDPDTSKVTGSTDVPALSYAAGMMFDVLKSPRGKPFKVGFFMGQDRVSKSATVSYPQNAKWWVALQLGYDFTDN